MNAIIMPPKDDGGFYTHDKASRSIINVQRISVGLTVRTARKTKRVRGPLKRERKSRSTTTNKKIIKNPRRIPAVRL